MQEPANKPEVPTAPEDPELVRRVLAGETALFEVLMRRHNQQVYRTVRAVLGEEAEAEDAMQAAYLAAFAKLGQFDGRARFSTWLVRIAVNEALGRRRKGATRLALLGQAPEEGVVVTDEASREPTPEEKAQSRELVAWLERAVDTLPEGYRTVFMLREIEGMSYAEAGEALGLTEDAAKTRFHRARALVREHLERALGRESARAFPFHATRCDRVVRAVMGRIPRS